MIWKQMPAPFISSVLAINLVILTACGVMGEPRPYVQTEAYLKAQEDKRAAGGPAAASAESSTGQQPPGQEPNAEPNPAKQNAPLKSK